MGFPLSVKGSFVSTKPRHTKNTLSENIKSHVDINNEKSLLTCFYAEKKNISLEKGR
jgi:hypothetical protein